MNDLYTATSEKHLPLNQQTFYPEIKFEWSFSVYLTAKNSSEYSYTFTSNPAPNISVQYKKSSFELSDKIPTSVVYSAMADSVFNNFSNKLVQAFGI